MIIVSFSAEHARGEVCRLDHRRRPAGAPLRPPPEDREVPARGAAGHDVDLGGVVPVIPKKALSL